MIDNFFDQDKIRIPDIEIDLNIKVEKIERILQESDLPQNQFFCHFIADKKQDQKASDRGYLLPQFRNFS